MEKDKQENNSDNIIENKNLPALLQLWCFKNIKKTEMGYEVTCVICEEIKSNKRVNTKKRTSQVLHHFPSYSKLSNLLKHLKVSIKIFLHNKHTNFLN